ncbi:nuclear transport factor 2 family protein [uncultured Winogradskyella sp.]|uniref:nuclear transport factor 2 family protein n=1 Tax=uncultured Winogradskyella sp. TaxID=395353 RepID=UPI0025CCB308|nr:nuclear transport factor 2 family protein [uncultured Winogradskyella sp.]
MKNLLVLGCIIILFSSCEEKPQRYFAESDETKTLEAGIASYESGNWDKWRSHFADTAKIYVNSKDAINLQARTEQLASMTGAFSSYGFEKDKAYIEMVLDKDNESWVYYWAQHSGTMKNGTEISMPVHLAVQFTDGKITAEHIYFDATDMNAAMEAMEMAAIAAEEAEMAETESTEEN